MVLPKKTRTEAKDMKKALQAILITAGILALSMAAPPGTVAEGNVPYPGGWTYWHRDQGGVQHPGGSVHWGRRKGGVRFPGGAVRWNRHHGRVNVFGVDVWW